MYFLGTKSRNALEGVHPLLQDVVRMTITKTEQDFSVTEGIRSFERQREYVYRGVSRTMNSKHLIQPDGLGHAVDLVPYIHGELRWEIDLCCVIARAMRSSAAELGANIRWGGAWVLLTPSEPVQKMKPC